MVSLGSSSMVAPVNIYCADIHCVPKSRTLPCSVVAARIWRWISYQAKTWFSRSGYYRVLPETAAEGRRLCSSASPRGRASWDCSALLQTKGHTHLQLSATKSCHLVCRSVFVIAFVLLCGRIFTLLATWCDARTLQSRNGWRHTASKITIATGTPSRKFCNVNVRYIARMESSEIRILIKKVKSGKKTTPPQRWLVHL